ncbi:MAG TPA: class I SAM-dependent methyltransferase [Kofleriaceae bacterium]|nr:class I SAM-dependent methyltransferase [Kofleriaceae bacterium]
MVSQRRAPGRAVRHDTEHTIGLVAPYLRDGDAVLDIGCGPAHVTAGIAARGHDAWGVDIVDVRESELASFALYDGTTLDFPARRFDVVLLAFVLHHVPNELKPVLIGEACRVCRRVVLIVEDTPRNAIDRLFSHRHGVRYRKKIGSTAAFGFYSQSEWEALFAREQLAVVESRALSRLCRDWKQPFARSFFAVAPCPP